MMSGPSGGGFAGISHSNHTSADNALASNSLMTSKHAAVQRGGGPKNAMILRG